MFPIDPKYLTDVAPDLALFVVLILPLLSACGKVGVVWAAWQVLTELAKYIKQRRINIT